MTSSPNVTRDIISRIDENGFNIVDAKKIKFTHNQAEAFYGEHKGKFFYPRLYNYVRSGTLGIRLFLTKVVQATLKQVL